MTAQEELDKALAAYNDGKTYSYNGKKYSLTKLRDDLIPLLEGLVAEQEVRISSRAESRKIEERASGNIKEQTKLAIERAKTQKQIAEGSINSTRQKFTNGEITEKEYLTALELPGKIDADIKAMESGTLQGKISGFNSYEIVGQKPSVSSSAAKEGGVQNVKTKKVIGVATIIENGNNVEVTTYEDAPPTKRILGKAPAGTEDTPANEVPKTIVNPQDSTVGRKEYVDAQLKEQGLVDTPANRKKLRQEYDATKTAATDTAWENIFRDAYPSKAWLLDLDRTKYPQLFSLIQEYSKPRPLTQAEKEAFATKLDGTDFYKELSQSGKVREIKNIVGDLGFDKKGTDFTKFVSDSINFGWTGDRLKQETYKEAFRRGADNQYINPTAIKRVKASADYLNVVNDARAYFNTAGADEKTVESVLTGEIAREDFLRQQREIAKQRYKHLADLIDQGVSLESLSGSFKQSAAKLLELDPTTIDMSTGDFDVALNFGEEGKRRVMTSGEWEKLLRTDSRFGWEKTENAKTEARSLASSLAQAFGRII